MATTVTDDIDGTRAECNRTFTFRGKGYEIDLNSEHAAELDAALQVTARFASHAREVGLLRMQARPAQEVADDSAIYQDTKRAEVVARDDLLTLKRPGTPAEQLAVAPEAVVSAPITVTAEKPGIRVQEHWLLEDPTFIALASKVSTSVRGTASQIRDAIGAPSASAKRFTWIDRNASALREVGWTVNAYKGSNVSRNGAMTYELAAPGVAVQPSAGIWDEGGLFYRTLTARVTERFSGSTRKLLTLLDPDGSLTALDDGQFPYSPGTLGTLLESQHALLLTRGWKVSKGKGVWMLDPPAAPVVETRPAAAPVTAMETRTAGRYSVIILPGNADDWEQLKQRCAAFGRLVGREVVVDARGVIWWTDTFVDTLVREVLSKDGAVADMLILVGAPEKLAADVNAAAVEMELDRWLEIRGKMPSDVPDPSAPRRVGRAERSEAERRIFMAKAATWLKAQGVIPQEYRGRISKEHLDLYRDHEAEQRKDHGGDQKVTAPADLVKV